MILTDFDTADYCDSLRITDSTHNSPEQIAALLFKSPKWVDVLMSLRNLAMKPFGLKTGPATFPLIVQNDKERIMGLADRHLTFRVSVLTDSEKAYVYVTTVVHYNNHWGKVYFLFVKPFHKIILYATMKKLLKKLKRNEENNINDKIMWKTGIY
jgi:hypothetical protein